MTDQPLLDRQKRLENMFNEGAPIAKTFGMTLAFDSENRAVITLPYNPGLDHAQRGVHGGVYMTLLDTAAWFTSVVSHEEECWVATSEMSVHFLKPSSSTELRAVGRVLKGGRRQDIVEATVYDQWDNEVGHGVGTFMILSGVPLPLR